MRRSLVVGLLLLASSSLLAQNRGTEEIAVRAVVDRYLHGLKFNDTTSLREAFWPDARLFYVTPDSLLGQWTQSSWYASFAGNIGNEEQGSLQIASVDVTGDIATAKVVEEYPDLAISTISLSCASEAVGGLSTRSTRPSSASVVRVVVRVMRIARTSCCVARSAGSEAFLNAASSSALVRPMT